MSLDFYENKAAYINSPNLFLGTGSSLLLPDRNQECRIWNSNYLGTASAVRGRLASNQCSYKHWIKSKSSDGSVVVLEDNSVWNVDVVDRVYSMIWLPIQNVIVCDGIMYNLDNKDKAQVTPAV